jgi:hypothetical protein
MRASSPRKHHELAKKMWHKNAMEYYSPLIRKGILIRASTWMSPGNVK